MAGAVHIDTDSVGVGLFEVGDESIHRSNFSSADSEIELGVFGNVSAWAFEDDLFFGGVGASTVSHHLGNDNFHSECVSVGATITFDVAENFSSFVDFPTHDQGVEESIHCGCIIEVFFPIGSQS